MAVMTSPLHDFSTSWTAAIVAALSAGVFGYLVYVKYRPGLRSIPGPLLAAVSNIDRIITAASGKQFLAHIKYHERYGPLVRVGPNHVSFSNADLIPVVYGITTKFYKVGKVFLLYLDLISDRSAERLLYSI